MYKLRRADVRVPHRETAKTERRPFTDVTSYRTRWAGRGAAISSIMAIQDMETHRAGARNERRPDVPSRIALCRARVFLLRDSVFLR